jgi:DNA polymerase III delta prime subunit
MNNIQHSIWNEKYRSQTLKDYLCDAELKNKFQTFINYQDIPHIGLFGSQGLGKSTLAKILVNSIECDFLHINAADERGIEVIRDKVGSFASSNSFKPLKIVVLEESTILLNASQIILLDMMERYSMKTRFILTGNYPERLIPPLRSRLQEFKLLSPTKKETAKHMVKILENENVNYDLNDVAKIIHNAYPDFRKIINDLQKYTIDGNLIIPSKLVDNSDFAKSILDELKSPTKYSFNKIRQIVANSENSSYEEIFKFLYNSSSEFAPNNEGQLTFIINEHMYQANFKVDFEINFMSCISRILETIK